MISLCILPLGVFMWSCVFEYENMCMKMHCPRMLKESWCYRHNLEPSSMGAYKNSCSVLQQYLVLTVEPSLQHRSENTDLWTHFLANKFFFANKFNNSHLLILLENILFNRLIRKEIWRKYMLVLNASLYKLGILIWLFISWITFYTHTLLKIQ